MDIRLNHFTKRFGTTTVISDMNLTIKSGEMLALLGPSGCGKSTTLFAICGIHKMDEGRLMFGGEDVTDKTSQERGAGVVFQSYALYPHMSVEENIAFPLKVRRDKSADVRRQVNEMAELVQIGPYLKRKPSELSGGQQQRVALARALIRRPHVLLLDEPLANLDAKLRLEMRAEIRRIQQETGITAVLVTHDQVEAMSMCDRIALMQDGKILQIDEPMEMYRRPVSSFVASFLGNPPISFLDGSLQEGQFHADGIDLKLPTKNGASASKTRIGVRPENFHPKGDATVTGQIAFIEAQGRETLYDVRLRDGSVLRSIQEGLPSHTLGDEVRWGIDTQHTLVFDEDGRRI